MPAMFCAMLGVARAAAGLIALGLLLALFGAPQDQVARSGQGHVVTLDMAAGDVDVAAAC
ncbi:hypothetical protein [Stenotrophomonas sp. 169]|uniref:hypothetical protein n=1 Tax=Stenotrophomonas sp. 169 TaxID=2770322 RepID=UPI001EFF4159|nr:hypothetical protein [Stenotrophomonas sp. 169]